MGRAVLVVGGAGYIGSHTARALLRAGHAPVLLDNLCAGHAEVAARLGVPLEIADIGDAAALDAVLARVRPEAVLHFAAFAQVGESVADPAKYYSNNVAGTLTLLDALRRAGVSAVVFSSSCATYGMPVRAELDEDHPQAPISPYGWTKLMAEKILADYSQAYGLRYAALRYFNAAGASEDGLLGEQHDPETHLVPICILAALGRRGPLTVFGDDYPTPDGTCIRDYIHVEDLAEAHVRAAEALWAGTPSFQANLGTGEGHSVREVLAAVAAAAGKEVPHRFGPRRAGDPPRLVAAPGKARTLLGWEPRRPGLAGIVASAWRWHAEGQPYAANAAR